MLQVAIRAAREAGRLLAEGYNRPHQIISKGFRDIVTEADLAAETVALRIIREGCPDARFVSEESNNAQLDHGDLPTWYVDPLDGTTNFSRGLPAFSVSVALAVQRKIVCGVVFDPIQDQLFCAERGRGAYLDGRRLRVSSRSRLVDGLVLLDFPRDQSLRQTSVAFLSRLALQVGQIRSRGSAALAFCCVAAGWVEAYYQYTLGPWDAAAGALIAEEAGGKVTNLRGEPYTLDGGDFLVTNGLVHQAILAARPYG